MGQKGVTRRGRIMKRDKGALLITLLALFFFALTTVASDRKVADIFQQLCLEADIMNLETHDVRIVKAESFEEIQEKDWTIILYISADNNLAPFSIRNIRQMARVGSNEHFNIVVQLDIHKTNGEKVTRRYFIEKGRILHLNADDPYSQCMDSGDPETLISCCDWAINSFPAKAYGLILWNHGSGILDPERYRPVKAEEMFMFNTRTARLELERDIGYLDRMLQRGICFDDSTGNYLTNQDLDYALQKICDDYLYGEKFSFIGFDACLMPMIEVANLVKKYAHVMIGSQESGLGYGWNYADAFAPFTEGPLELVDLAQHFVQSYQRSYENIVGDYTLSAVNLDLIEELEQNVNAVACVLLEGLRAQKEGMVKKTIKASRSGLVCTHFDEPSYIDLHHFYSNLLSNINYMQLRNPNGDARFKEALTSLLSEGLELIETLVFAYTSGRSLPLARGISIYFPEQKIHSSYSKTLFAEENEWITFLTQYLIL